MEKNKSCSTQIKAHLFHWESTYLGVLQSYKLVFRADIQKTTHNLNSEKKNN